MKMIKPPNLVLKKYGIRKRMRGFAPYTIYGYTVGMFLVHLLYIKVCLVYLRIDAHFADIHGFMNVALVGAIP